MINKIALIAILALVALAGQAVATTYYVAKDGNDTNDGLAADAAHAWLTLNKARTTMVAGDTVYIRSGNYNEKLYIQVGGTESGGWISYKAYPGESPVIDGTGLDYSSQNGAIYAVNKNYIHIEGLTVTGVATSSAYPIVFLGTTTPNTWTCGLNIIDVTVERCPSSQAGIAVIGQYGYCSITVQGCEAKTLTTNAQEAIRIDGKSWYAKVIDCLIQHVTNIGIVINGKPTAFEIQPRYVYVANNRVDRQGGSDTGNPYYIDGAQYCVFENNVAYDSHGGIAVACETAGLTATANIVRKNLSVGSWHYGLTIGSAADRGDTRLNRIYNNTIINNDNIGLLLGFYKDGATNKAINNLFYTTVDPNYMVYSYEGNTVTSAAYGMDYNLHYPNNEIYQIKGVNYTGLADWVAHADGNDSLGTIGTDPLLTATWTLGAGSPAIDAGNTLTTTSDAGTGTVFSVVDSRFFHDTWNGWITADTIRVGADTVTITNIDYASNSITVSASFTWTPGEAVSLPFTGAKPDIGYAEYSATSSSDDADSAIIQNLRLIKNWADKAGWKW